MQQHIKIIPADPGYYALDRSFIPGGITIIREPVVAWCIRIEDDSDPGEYHMEPICLEMLSGSYENEVLHPDGRVIRFGVQTWNSFVDFENEVMSRFEYTNPKYKDFVTFFEGRNDNEKRNLR